MRKYIFVLSLSFLFSFSSWAQSGPVVSGDVVSLDAIEASVNQNLSTVVQDFDYMEEASIRVNKDYSDLATGNIELQLKALTQPLLANAGEKLSLEGSLKTQMHELEDGNKFFVLESKIVLSAHVLLLLKNVARTFGECQILPLEEAQVSSNHVSNIICMIMDGIRAAEKVVDLEKSFIAASNYAKAVFGDGSGDLLTKILSSIKIKATPTDLTVDLGLDLDSFDLELESQLLFKEGELSLTVTGQAEVDSQTADKYIVIVQEYAKELADPESEMSFFLSETLYTVVGILEAFLIIEED